MTRYPLLIYYLFPGLVSQRFSAVRRSIHEEASTLIANRVPCFAALCDREFVHHLQTRRCPVKTLQIPRPASRSYLLPYVHRTNERVAISAHESGPPLDRSTETSRCKVSHHIEVCVRVR